MSHKTLPRPTDATHFDPSSRLYYKLAAGSLMVWQGGGAWFPAFAEFSAIKSYLVDLDAAEIGRAMQ